MVSQMDPLIGMQKAEALHDAGRYRAAATAFEQMAELDGCRAAAQRGWGRALEGLGNVEEAASHFEAAIDADPEDASTYSEVESIWSRLESPDVLLGRVQRRIGGLASAPAHAALAALLNGIDRPDAALAERARAAEIDPKNAELRMAWAVALGAAGQHSEAVQQCEIAISLIDGEIVDADPFEPLLSALRALRAPDDAIARVDKAVDAGDRADLQLRWAATLYALGRADDGAQVYEKVAADPARRIEGLLAWAYALENSGDSQAALLKFEEIIALDASLGDGYRAVARLAAGPDVLGRIEPLVDRSDSAAAHVWWAMALWRIGRHAAAVQEFETAFRLSAQPTDRLDWVHGAWADCLETLGQLDEAVDQRLRAVANGGRHHWGLTLLPDLLRRFAPSQRDIARLQVRVDALDDGGVYLEWADALEQLGETDAAALQYRKAAAKDRKDIAPVIAVSRLLAKQGRHREAVLEYQDAIEHDSADEEAFAELLSNLRRVDDVTRTTLVDSVQSWIDVGAGARTRHEWGKVMLELGRLADAVRELEASIELDSDNPLVQVALGSALEADGKPARALESHTRALALGAGEPDSLKAALDGFRAAFLKAGGEEALAKIDKAILTIDGVQVYLSWADTLDVLGRTGAALAHSRRAFEKDRTSAGLCVDHGYRLVGAGHTDEGLALNRAAAEREPMDAYFQYAWGQSLARARRHGEAIERFRNAVELRSDENPYEFHWALALEGLGSYDAAIAMYRESIVRSNDPINTAYCRHNIASLHERQGDFRAAGKAWDLALRAYADATADATQKSQGYFFFYCGTVHHEAKQDFDAATKLYTRALALRPNDPEVLAGIFRLYRQRIGQLPPDAAQSQQATEFHWKALDAYERARKGFEVRIADLATAPMLVELGKLHLGMDDHDAARNCFVRALDIEKDLPEACDMLARAHMGAEDFKAALQPARTAVALEPYNLGIRTTLADVYQKLNSLDKAEIEYKKVLAVAPHLLDALVGLGNTYVALGEDLQKNGKSSDAENMFMRALDQFAQAIGVEGKDWGSRRLSPAERAALSYSRGYANVMCYEAQTLAKRDEKLLQAALGAFDEVPTGDANFYKAQRAKQKIRERNRPAERSARLGVWIIGAGAFVTFAVANVAFLFGKPGLVPTFQVTPESLQALKAAQLPNEVVAKLQPIAQHGAATKAVFDRDLKSALGDDLAKKYGDAIREPAAAGRTLGWQESLDAGYYALLSFGAMMFMVAGLYLQQLSKLKFGGIELEKTSETTAKVSGPLGITK